MSRAAVFVDRDGVLTELVADPRSGLPESPLHPQDVALIEGAAAALGRLRDAGYLLVGVTNQPAAAKGVVGIDELNAVQERVVALFEQEGVLFDRFAVCFHHPEGVVPELTKACGCRKPAPGMLTDAARELGLDLDRSWLVGDTDTDVAAGVAAGARTVVIENPASAHKREGSVAADLAARDLTAAADAILRADPR
jgi:D-glycero-D-manno-heptose 1,7-bisphosphate phosphatase